MAGSFEEKADAALAAGCDLVLHCNGDMTEMRAVADGASRISDAAKVRLRAAEERVSAVAGEGIDPAEALARLKALIGDQGT